MKPARFLPFSRRGSSKGSRDAADRDLVATAFDAEYYLANNPDVAATGADPLRHFMSHGWREGRDPAPDFSVNDYMEMNPDVATSGANPYVHYLRHGRDEGRPGRNTSAPSRELRALIDRHFDTEFYLSRNKDVASLGLDPVEHFLHEGWRERRDPSPTFSVATYLAQRPDVAAAGVNPFVHFLNDELVKERARARALELAQMDEETRYKLIEPEFDVAFYREQNPDVPESSDAALHYLRNGWKEGRDPAPWFSSSRYIKDNTDVAEAAIEPFSHFLSVGRNEGRRTFKTVFADVKALGEAHEAIVEAFDAAFYQGINRDIGGDIDPIDHYLRHGWQEGRDPAPWFSTRGYLELNEDVAAAELNPFVHYITSGRDEGRTIRQPFRRWEATSARPDSLPPLPVYTQSPTLLTPAIITRRIIESVGVDGTLLVSVSDVDPADATGSAGVALASEAATVAGIRLPYLNLHPEAPRPGFAARAEDPVLRLLLGGTLIGSAKTSSVIEALMAVRYTMVVDMVFHGLAGHHPERLAAYAGLSGGRRMMWLHDYWLACPCRRLLNPDGRTSNPITGEPAHSCRFDKGRPEQTRRVGAFLSETKFTYLAPSLAAKRNARRLPVADPQLIVVAPQLSVGPAADGAVRNAASGPIRVAFAADPLDDCAWPLFQEIARRHAFDGNHTFVTFMPRPDLPHFISYIPVETQASAESIAEAMMNEAIDVVLVAPSWPVPVSRAAHAALAAGCAIISTEGSGNAVDLAAQAPHHLVLPTDEAVLEAFAGGAVADLVAQLRAAPIELQALSVNPAPLAPSAPGMR
ncbi:hypothetical protein [Acuticoccus sediminis]|uniref:hypothetical protein n=1 Tax=Acuticoccus sediminis TaxID=2184697 RepID=UPI0011B94594|nr:hypothetical protein [Acuticoccus sediminis]